MPFTLVGPVSTQLGQWVGRRSCGEIVSFAREQQPLIALLLDHATTLPPVGLVVHLEHGDLGGWAVAVVPDGFDPRGREYFSASIGGTVAEGEAYMRARDVTVREVSLVDEPAVVGLGRFHSTPLDIRHSRGGYSLGLGAHARDVLDRAHDACRHRRSGAPILVTSVETAEERRLSRAFGGAARRDAPARPSGDELAAAVGRVGQVHRVYGGHVAYVS